ncbi:MAG: hypothetical protein J6C37_12395 [Roseburia sp.]|nr:hypothetical protein [Roseburia sp.]
MKKYYLVMVKIAIGVVILGVVGYIMFNHLGLDDSLNFGAGAYYYADMPGVANLVDGRHYISEIPMWGIVFLFLLWGYFVYSFWVWLEKKL